MSDRPYVNFKEVKERCAMPEVLERLGLKDQFTEKNGVWTAYGQYIQPRYKCSARQKLQELEMRPFRPIVSLVIPNPRWRRYLARVRPGTYSAIAICLRERGGKVCLIYDLVGIRISSDVGP